MLSRLYKYVLHICILLYKYLSLRSGLSIGAVALGWQRPFYIDCAVFANAVASSPLQALKAQCL